MILFREKNQNCTIQKNVGNEFHYPLVFRKFYLPRPELPVSGVTEAGDNVTDVV